MKNLAIYTTLISLVSCMSHKRSPSGLELVDYNCIEAPVSFKKLDNKLVADIADDMHSLWQQNTHHQTRFKPIATKDGEFKGSLEEYLKENKIPADYHKYYRVGENGLEEDIKFIPNRYLSFKNANENDAGAEAALMSLKKLEEKSVKSFADALENTIHTAQVMHESWMARNKWAEGDANYNPDWFKMRQDLRNVNLDQLEIAVKTSTEFEDSKREMMLTAIEMLRSVKSEEDLLSLQIKVRETDIDPLALRKINKAAFDKLSVQKIVELVKEALEEIHTKWLERNSWAAGDELYAGKWADLRSDMQKADLDPLYIAFKNGSELTQKSKDKLEQAIEIVVDEINEKAAKEKANQ